MIKEEEESSNREGEASQSREKTKYKMATLANLKQVCPELQLDQSRNNEKQWQQFIDNSEAVLAFEEIEADKKMRAALFAVTGQEVRDIFKTLEEEEPNTYVTAKTALENHFKGQKNLTAERYRFLCMKPESEDETHDHWITRLK